jgi:tRNA pseudouridine55 synthase
VTLQPRLVQIYGIDLLRYDWPHLELEVRCGKGTYVRSLARDLGERLGCGALVAMLRRTRVGPFAADEAVSLEAPPEEARARLLPAGLAVAELPRVTLPPREVRRLRQGQAAALPPDFAAEGEEVAVFDELGTLAAMAAPDRARRTLRPVKVL